MCRQTRAEYYSTGSAEEGEAEGDGDGDGEGDGEGDREGEGEGEEEAQRSLPRGMFCVNASNSEVMGMNGEVGAAADPIHWQCIFRKSVRGLFSLAHQKTRGGDRGEGNG